MYKKQMLFQKIICYLVLIASAGVFIYSLGFMTDLFEGLYLVAGEIDDYEAEMVEGASILYRLQPFNRELTVAGIVLILISVFLLVMNTHTRRKYYVGNYVAIAASVIANIAVAVWSVTNILDFKNWYLTGVNFEELTEYYVDHRMKDPGIKTFWFDASIPVIAFLLVATVLLVLNLIWKISLMKAENKLIAEGKDAK